MRNREKWKRELITQVQKMANELGKTPTAAEFNNNPAMMSSSMAVRLFGSWSLFLETAGLDPADRRPTYTKEVLIGQVQNLTKKLGRVPILVEFKKDPDTATIATVLRWFGSWDNFIQEAGIEVCYKRGYTEKELIVQVQELAKKLGRPPRVAEFNKNSGTASYPTVARKFGSWNKFLEVAGVKSPR